MTPNHAVKETIGKKIVLSLLMNPIMIIENKLVWTDVALGCIAELNNSGCPTDNLVFALNSFFYPLSTPEILQKNPNKLFGPICNSSNE